jgi:nondiscriminating glutamyl-tRNA synthetase
MKIRTRIAPSPTGPQMHIGNFRTALYCYLWAQKNNGEFILRVEDTDRKRYVKGSVEGYLDLFETFGIQVDKHPTREQIAEMDEVTLPDQDWILKYREMPNINYSDYKDVYIQTQRLPLYLKYAFELVNSKFAYLCFLSEEELAKTKEALPKGQPFRSPHRELSKDEVYERVKSGQPYVVRLDVQSYIKKSGTSEVEYEDLVLGKMRFDLNTVDDQVLVKSNGIPTYHLAVVIDDHFMDISHPIRGYGWLPSTPKQVMLYNMFGWEMRPFAHVTDILNPEGGKLSKRRGAVFTMEFVKQGFLTEAIINFIALVGWTPKIERKHGEAEREIFSLEELIELFSIEGISNANPTFDIEKLKWFNKEYIKAKPLAEFTRVFANWVEKYSDEKEFVDLVLSDAGLEHKLALVKERSTTLKDTLEQIRFFYVKPDNIDWNIKQLEKVKDKIEVVRKDIIELFKSLEEDSSLWTHEKWENAMRGIADKHEVKHGDGFMVLRVATVGGPYSPPLFEALQILGKDEVLKRLKA